MIVLFKHCRLICVILAGGVTAQSHHLITVLTHDELNRLRKHAFLQDIESLGERLPAGLSGVFSARAISFFVKSL
jgi:hypothetical protein